VESSIYVDYILYRWNTSPSCWDRISTNGAISAEMYQQPAELWIYLFAIAQPAGLAIIAWSVLAPHQ
jgi:hypothetical protein